VQADSMSAVLDALAKPIILLSETCEITHCNQLAGRLLESNEVITEEGKRIRLSSQAENNALMAKIFEVVRSSMGLTSYLAETQYVKRSGKPDIVLCITPIENLEQGGGALLSVLDPEQRDFPGAESIGCYFSLSKAESLLCEDLVMGFSLKDIAQRRYRSEATLRSTLKNVYEKTGLNRQGLLVSAILSALID
jgi:DNA-binding CsgD family transcriptional regulator